MASAAERHIASVFSKQERLNSKALEQESHSLAGHITRCAQ